MTQTTATLNTQFYTWKNYRCAYEHYSPDVREDRHSTPLLLIHPIGVGLSRRFWHRFCKDWYRNGHTNPIYNPDLLGCGESEMPYIAYTPADWAAQLQHFLQTVIQSPVTLVVQDSDFCPDFQPDLTRENNRCQDFLALQLQQPENSDEPFIILSLQILMRNNGSQKELFITTVN